MFLQFNMETEHNWPNPENVKLCVIFKETL